jgi:hypothetical protein
VTQIVSVITKEYAWLVSDRRLTYGDGPKVGQVLSDDTCKLVSLCNICGIGYSGLANLGGSPTHEWIAKTLAAANCHDAGNASQIIGNSAPGALPQVLPELRRQIFIVAGWAQFDNPPGLRSHFCVVTNALDDAGRVLVLPHAQFSRRVRALRDDVPFLWYSIQPLRTERAQALERNLRRLVARDIGPKEALRLLVDEILVAHQTEEPSTVGDKVLGF